MRLHYLQHVPFEDLGNIANWAEANNVSISATKLHKKQQFPSLDQFDLLVILGGPMNIYEYDRYSWLKEEKVFIKSAIDAGKKLLGVCLGAQLIADVVGGKVIRNQFKEIGWHKIKRTTEKSYFFQDDFKEFKAFHWHGDTFVLPENIKSLYSSEACQNQAFEIGDKVLGLQFHVEYSKESIEKMLVNDGAELDGSHYVQSAEQIISEIDQIKTIHKIMDKVLSRLL